MPLVQIKRFFFEEGKNVNAKARIRLSLSLYKQNGYFVPPLEPDGCGVKLSPPATRGTRQNIQAYSDSDMLLGD